MPGRDRFLRTSAQEVDPLSWFVGPFLPLAFAGLIFLFGTVMTVVFWGSSPQPGLQLAGLWLAALGGLVIHVRSRPLQRPIGYGSASIALGAALLGMILSALDYRGTSLDIGLWWGPGAPALILLGLAPYLPVRKVLVLGIATTVAASTAGFLILYPVDASIGPVTTALVFAYPPAMSTAGAALFSYTIVSRVSRALESPSRIMVPGQTVRDEAVQELERVTLARLTARAAPFLLQIADAGEVTHADRSLAGQLARRLRDDLVTQADASWLDAVASDTRLVVIDPERLARHMTNAQRTALRAMLRAILELPETDTGSLHIELRRAPDGATAAAVSMDAALPEGRRIMHLAPYYLTLGTAVDDLEFDRDRLTFRIPSEATAEGRLRARGSEGDR